MSRFDHLATNPRGPGDMLRWKVLDRLPGRRPPRRADFADLDRALPAVVDGGAAALASGAPVACWIGHATWALRLGGRVVVIDPIWGGIGRVVPRLVGPGVPLEAMPPVDVVAVTHDHMDHMDLPTLRRLGPDPLYVVPLGNAPRLTRLGLPNVVELDWWQSHRIGDLELTLVPARHWSMRTPWTRNATLWGGYVVRAPEGVAYHSGDTAYGEHFVEIARRIGPIDWAMLPIGAYDPRWFMESQHVDPREATQAFVDLRARHFLAMHWGTFRLTDEPIGEPPVLLRAAWQERALDAATLHVLAPGGTVDL